MITSLALHDNGFMSKHLIRIWTSGSPSGDETTNSGSLGDLFQRGGQFSAGPLQTRGRSASRLSAQPTTGRGRGRCSLGLRNFIYNMFGTILLSRPEDFYSWCMDAIVEMMVWEEPGNISLHLVRLLLQVVQGARGLALLIDKLENIRHMYPTKVLVPGGKQPPVEILKSREVRKSSASAILTGFDMTTESAYHPVLIYFLSLPKGLHYCANGNGVDGDGQWLASLLSNFEANGARKYVYDYDILAARSLNASYIRNVLCPRPELEPIPFLSRDLSSTYTNTTIAPTNIKAEISTVDAIQTHNVAIDSTFMVKSNLSVPKGSFSARSGSKKGDSPNFSSMRNTEDVSRGSCSNAAIGSTGTR